MDPADHQHDVAVGRASFTGSTPAPAEHHLVLLVPPYTGCTTQPGPSSDLDQDGDVDFEDLLALLSVYGPCVNCELCPADLALPRNREVEFMDLVMMLSQFTDDCVDFSGPLESVQDCWERYGSDLAAFEACVESVQAP